MGRRRPAGVVPRVLGRGFLDGEVRDGAHVVAAGRNGHGAFVVKDVSVMVPVNESCGGRGREKGEDDSIVMMIILV